MCDRTATCPGEDRLRRASRCSLPDFDQSRWDRAADKHAARDAEGRADMLIGEARAQGIALEYDLDRDGCAWGWALSIYAQSVSEYMGQRDTSDPRRSQNPRLWRRVMRDEDEPTELLDAVALLTAYEDGAFSQFADAVAG
jgi:hypothetical protein